MSALVFSEIHFDATSGIRAVFFIMRKRILDITTMCDHESLYIAS